jgi:soluble lytic murein transglycosylase-like protein
MTVTQLSFLSKTTLAQYVYSRWMMFYKSDRYLDARPSEIIERTAEDTRLDYDLVDRIVRIQSRWNARKVLRSAPK